MTMREELERQEAQTQHPAASRSAESRGRQRAEEPDPLRPAFQLDRDRILHSKAFRRLAGKTQVFLRPEGDHYRTRITHTLEVSQIARTCARALRLNEVLTEAMALGHDLGHTPFGHAGESVLARLMSESFHHAKQSLRVVEVLERDGRGLNLCHETRDGILKHSKGKGSIFSENPNLLAMTLEGQVVRVSDIVAYVNHDLDDAVRGKVLREDEVPERIAAVLGRSHSQRIARMVQDIVESSRLESSPPRILMSDECHQALEALRDFLYERLYENPEIRGEFVKAQRILEELWGYCLSHEAWFRQRHWPKGVPEGETLERAVADFVAGMTDRYALRFYEEVCLPRPWSVL
ncbi:MAG: deoxyguanosinetriphosphate triphosphohydrolase [Myxococcota bacterium]